MRLTLTKTFSLRHHTLTEHQPCSESLSLFAWWRPACPPLRSVVSIDNFCGDCRAFWTSHSISSEESRELATRFRITHGFVEELTPTIDAAGNLTFLMDGESQTQEFANVDLDENVAEVSLVNTWAAIVKASESVPEPDELSVRNIESSSRRSSVSSTMTLWPDMRELRKEKMILD